MSDFAVPGHRDAHSVAGHWALWEKHIEHGDISIGNLMCDPVTKRGVLGDFDLSREGGPHMKPSAKDNARAIPFLALDLLNKRAIDGLVPHRYRHDAESFAWCLIYICICIGKSERGRIDTIRPHPLSSWFTSMGTSHSSKITLSSRELLKEFPLHERTKPLAVVLHDYWVTRYNDQSAAERSTRFGHTPLGSLESWIQPTETVQTKVPYQEHSDNESFKRVLILILRASSVVPKTRESTFIELVELITTLYPFVKCREVED